MERKDFNNFIKIIKRKGWNAALLKKDVLEITLNPDEKNGISQSVKVKGYDAIIDLKNMLFYYWDREADKLDMDNYKGKKQTPEMVMKYLELWGYLVKELNKKHKL